MREPTVWRRWRSKVHDILEVGGNAHPAGWPVTVTVNWHLTWTGSGNVGADLGFQTHAWNTNVPVAEVQTIVTGVS